MEEVKRDALLTPKFRAAEVNFRLGPTPPIAFIRPHVSQTYHAGHATPRQARASALGGRAP